MFFNILIGSIHLKCKAGCYFPFFFFFGAITSMFWFCKTTSVFIFVFIIKCALDVIFLFQGAIRLS